MAQLRPHDVAQHTYADKDGQTRRGWFITIVEVDGEDGTTVKTAGSERLVPVHSVLETLGFVLHLRRSKTDQDGQGRKIAIPHGRTRWCPVRHLTEWLVHAGIEQGPIFRSIDRHGHIAPDRLSGEAVATIMKRRVEAAGFDPSTFSGHSLRAGFATSAVIAGASTFKIRAQTGHKSDAMLGRYLRDGNLFVDNAVGAVL